MPFTSQTGRPSWQQAEQIRSAGADAAAAIRARRDLSTDGRKRQLARIHTAVRDRLDQLRQQDRDTVTARQDKLVRSLFSPNRYTSNPEATALERDAARTAAQVSTPDQARRLLAAADSMDDHGLARAVARRAAALFDEATPGLDQQPWADVLDTWATSPAAPAGAKDTISELLDIESEQLDPLARFGADAHYRPALPPELAAHAHRVDALAAAADDVADLRPPTGAELAGARMARGVFNDQDGNG